MIANINKLVEVPALKNFYSEQLDFSLLNSIKESDVKTPIVVSKNFQIIDGYRRVQVCKELGISSVPVIIVNDEASLNERITRNLTREKTPEDKIKEMQHIFKKYPKRQGKRKGNEKPYVRDEVISEALGNRWKGDVVLNKLEKILFNDVENNILSKGIVQNNWKIDTCYEFLSNLREVDIKNKWGYSGKLITGELSINEVNKFIKERMDLENKYKDTFVIPKKATSINIDCIKLGRTVKYYSKVDTIFTSIPYYSLRFYDKDELIEETKEQYCQRMSEYFKALIPLLKKSANVMINIGETYKDGVGLGIPDLLKDYIIKVTGLVYKDRLVWSKGNNTKPQNETIKRTVNNVEYILWFVVDPLVAKYKMLSYTDGTKDIALINGARDISNKGKVGNKNILLGKPYKKFYTHLKEQEILNVINCAAGKNHDVYKICSEGHPAIMSAALPVIPILMTTDEGDVVCDPFAGTNVVGRVTCLLNRIALTTERSKKYYDIGCKMLENSVNDFDRASLDLINEIAYHKISDYSAVHDLRDNLISNIQNNVIEDKGEKSNDYFLNNQPTYFENESQLFHNDNLEIIKNLPENSVSSIVTDSPYHLTQIIGTPNYKKKNESINLKEFYPKPKTGLMGKQWDGGDIAFREDFWKECLRVLKPGGFLLSFGHSRTYHKMATAIERAGFEIRDQIMWLYGQGLIKSHDIGKAVDKIQGNRRELVSVKKNNKIKMSFKYKNDNSGWLKNKYYNVTKGSSAWEGWGTSLKPAHEPIVVAKKPVSESTIAKNILSWNVGGINLGENKINESSYKSDLTNYKNMNWINNYENNSKEGRFPSNVIISEEINEDWSKYFYCAKASKNDKNEGLIEHVNTHPTVKPTELMQHLVRLVTPKGGICLDPFAGSGTTGKACAREGIKFILIEKESEYFEIAKQRIQYEFLKYSINPN